MSKVISLLACTTPLRRQGMMLMAPSPSVSDTELLPVKVFAKLPIIEGGAMSELSALGSVIMGKPLSSISSSSWKAVLKLSVMDFGVTAPK